MTFKNYSAKTLFLIDGIGAAVSAIMLAVVLVRFDMYIGIPKNALYFLAIWPCLFVLYDLYSYRKRSKNLRASLRGIAILNFAYCILSLTVICMHHETMTIWAWFYFIAEVIIVALLGTVELHTSKSTNS